MRRGLTALSAVLVLGLTAACGGEDPAPAPADGESSASTVTETPLAQAASRISPDALGDKPYVEFGQTAELLALGESDQRWLGVAALGNGLLANEPSADSIGVDAKAADYSIEVGMFPSRVGVLAGGQDAEVITDAAQQAGYQGKDVLTQQVDPSVPVTVSVQQLKPIEEDVVLATTDADVGWIDTGSLFADEQAGPVAVCLGDVLAAMIAEVDGQVVGVGVRAEGPDIVSVICIPGGDDAAADIEKDLEGPDFVDRVEIIDSQIVDGLAKVTVQHATGSAAVLMFSALTSQSLPGS